MPHEIPSASSWKEISDEQRSEASRACKRRFGRFDASGIEDAHYRPVSPRVVPNTWKASFFGFADANKPGAAIAATTASGYAASTYNSTAPIYIEQSASVYSEGRISSYDAEGFTLTWTKGGSPVGVAGIGFIAFR
jgi:hypothetical protein